MRLYSIIINTIFLIQVTINDCESSTMSDVDFKNHVGFFCLRPSMVFINNMWMPDYDQDCIKDEMGIVSYCRRKFPGQNITSAEPAIERTAFKRWCDFEGKNCVYNITIRPFKCLDSTMQSDALIIPRNCFFGHVTKDNRCKLYKDWILVAKAQCAKKPNFSVRSFGMLFQCGKSQSRVKPMFFKGVEYVCCPGRKKSRNSIWNTDKRNAFHPLYTNGVLETEDEEDQTYEAALRKLNQLKNETLTKFIDDYKKEEVNISKGWNSAPRDSRKEERKLISKFKATFGGMKYRFKDKEEKLLSLHDDRLKTIFHVKLDKATRHLDDLLKKPTLNKNEIRGAMIFILDLLMVRKKEILEEKFHDQNLNQQLIPVFTKELKIIERNITKLIKTLDKVPLFKNDIRQDLLDYMINKFPRITFEKIANDDNDQLWTNQEMNKIIEQNKHHSDIHFVNIPDETADKHVSNPDKKSTQKQKEHVNILYIIIGVLAVICMVLFMFMVAMVFCRRRSRRRHNSQEYKKKPHLIMNPTYEKSPMFQMFQSDLKTEPLIQS